MRSLLKSNITNRPQSPNAITRETRRDRLHSSLFDSRVPGGSSRRSTTSAVLLVRRCANATHSCLLVCPPRMSTMSNTTQVDDDLSSVVWQKMDDADPRSPSFLCFGRKKKKKETLKPLGESGFAAVRGAQGGDDDAAADSAKVAFKDYGLLWRMWRVTKPLASTVVDRGVRSLCEGDRLFSHQRVRKQGVPLMVFHPLVTH